MMKHLLFIISFFILQHTTLQAADAPLPTPLLQSFYKTFADANDVRWDQNGKLTVASFYLNGQRTFAYYNEAAELVVVAEPVSLNQLPDPLKKKLQKQYGKYTLSELFQLKDAQGVSYHAIFDTVNEKFFVKSNGQRWEVEKYGSK